MLSPVLRALQLTALRSAGLERRSGCRSGGAEGGGPRPAASARPPELQRGRGTLPSAGPARQPAAAPRAARVFIQEAQARHFLLPIPAALRLQVMVLTLSPPAARAPGNPVPAPAALARTSLSSSWDGCLGDPEQGVQQQPLVSYILPGRGHVTSWP